MATYKEFEDFVLDQIFGYQDANESVRNGDNVRDALIAEHQWDSNGVAVTHGVHKDNFLTNAMIQNSVVGGNKLKTASDYIFHIIAAGTTVINTTISTLLTNSDYYFVPQGDFWLQASGVGSFSIKVSCDIVSSLPATVAAGISNLSRYLETTLVGSKSAGVEGGAAVDAYHMTDSPPHRLGPIKIWGKFLTILRDKDTKKAVRFIISDDPIWFNHRKSEGFEKDDQFLPTCKPHPFMEYAPYTDKLPEEDNFEIVMVCLNYYNQKAEVRKEQAIADNYRACKDEMLAAGVTETKFIEELALKEKKAKDRIIVIKDTNKELVKLYKMRNKYNNHLRNYVPESDRSLKLIEMGGRVLESKIAYIEEEAGISTLWDKMNEEKANMKMSHRIASGEFPEILEADTPLDADIMAEMPKGNFEKYVRLVKPVFGKVKVKEKEVVEDEQIL